MTLEQIKIRMLQLKVDRDWLATACGWTKGNVVNVLAPKGSNRSPKAIARIKDALDREEERQRLDKLPKMDLGARVIIEPTQAQFDRWMKAAYATDGGNFDQWAKDGLGDAVPALPKGGDAGGGG